MSIKARIADAEFLWEGGRKESAWVSALIALAATSKIRYPKKKAGEAFRQFVRDIAVAIMTGEDGGPSPLSIRYGTPTNHRTLEDILYEELRCNLIHEGELADVSLSESHIKDGKFETMMCGPPQGAAEIPDIWVLTIIKALKSAPENADPADEA